ncbi:DUF1189 family protein [Candidatus Daviesbacteria bacterium]|nr:DUF1189 family protein [Candidatus Daviesbacteria bacterium]
MSFFKTIKNSVYSPAFYQQIPNKSFKSSLGYFLLLTLLLTIVSTLTFLGTLLKDVPAAAAQLLNSAVNCYPSELEVTVNRGQVTTNVAEPYFVPFCLGEPNSADYNNLVVVDTKTPFSAGQFNQYQTLAWLTKDALVYKENNLEVRVFDLSQIREFKLDKNMIISWGDKISPWLKFVGPVLAVLVIFGLYIFYSLKLIYLLFIALLIWLLAKIFKKVLTYGQSYKLGLYGVTLGFLVEILVGFTRQWTNFGGFPFMFTLITLGVVFINYFKPRPKS